MLLRSISRGRSAVLAATVVITVATGCGTDSAADSSIDDGTAPGPSTSAPLPPVFYVDPTSPAAEQSIRWQAEGRGDDAAELRKISKHPTAKWLTGGPAAVRDQVDAFVSQAAIAGQTPVLVAHNIPQRDCGRTGPGGASSGAAYRSWIRDFAAGINGRTAIVVFEPNAVADAVAGCVDDVDGRYALLKDAIRVLASTGSARIYLDAGHPFWIKDVRKLSIALKRAGIAEAEGFALNVGNFARTADNVSYGRRLSHAVGGDTSFVIDTSRNGNGPYPGDRVNGGPGWCNPPGRALGEEPTDDTGLPQVDALLWIKYPGESDGACRPGEPEAGNWWPAYALELARQTPRTG